MYLYADNDKSFLMSIFHRILQTCMESAEQENWNRIIRDNA